MRAERIGSYSMPSTVASTPSLLRLKSIERIFCLWPPPMPRAVTRPYMLRPPVFFRICVKLFSGRVFFFVISSNDEIVIYRVDGVRGLNDLTGIKLCKYDFIALAQGHHGLLPIRVLAGLRRALPAELARHVHRVDPHDLHLKQFLDRALDLELVRARIGHHGILVELLALARALFRQSGRLNNIKSIHGFTPTSVLPISRTRRG